MSTVIAFPGTRPVAPRIRTDRRASAQHRRPEGADIVILPVVRVERHEARLPGPVMPGSGMPFGGGRRAH